MQFCVTHASAQEAKERLAALRKCATLKDLPGAGTLEPVEPPEEPCEPEAEEPEVAKPKRVRKKGSRGRLSVVIGDSEGVDASDAATKPVLAEPKPSKVAPAAPAALLALPAPVKIAKTMSNLSTEAPSDGYDPNFEDAQNPRAFEKPAPETSLALLPPRLEKDVTSPQHPRCLLDKFSAAATGEVVKKDRRKPVREGSEDSDDLLSPGSFRTNLQKYLKESKDSWSAARIFLRALISVHVYS